MIQNKIEGKDASNSLPLSISPFTLIISTIALLSGVTIGIFNPILGIGIIGFLALIIIIILRQDEFLVTSTIALHLYLDWYLGLRAFALLLALMILVIFFLARSTYHPWGKPCGLRLWVLFLTLTLFPAIYGSLNLYDADTYYPSVIFGAFIMFYLGTIVSQNRIHLQRFFKVLAGLGVLLAIHTIIQSKTGIFLFGTEHYNDYLTQVGNYQLANSDAHRSGSFLIDPNWNGTLFAMMIFLPLGLFITSSSFIEKVLYLFETMLLLTALLFTYSNGAWLGAIAGIASFTFFIGKKRYKVLIISIIAISAIVFIAFFPSYLSLQFAHASNPEEVILRTSAWQTALRTIQAFPLTGVGLGYQAYLLRTQPFLAPSSQMAYSQPHNSYLEWGTMAGIPILLLFIVLLLFTLGTAVCNWAKSDMPMRSLIGSGISAAVALSFNSLTINGWTHPVLSEVGWMLLGAVTSPLLMKSLQSE